MKNKMRVLLISPTWVNIHSDIHRQLEEMGYEVCFIPENSFPEDSYRVKGRKKEVSSSAEESMKSEYWRQHIDYENKYFDYLIVVDGQGINDVLFKTLKSVNPDIYCVNYLYDTTHSVYHFDKNFGYFDRVFTFDRQESEKYGIELLPIYWTPTNSNKLEQKYDVFGFGSYSKSRYRLYRFIDEIANQLGKRAYIKVYHNQIKRKWLHLANNLVRKILRRPALISLSEYKSDLISNQLLSTNDFRNFIESSDVIIDSKVLDQDGLTARFMWALGAEKKIITTNSVARYYPFFTENQILVLDENKSLHRQEKLVRDFLSSDFEMDDKCRETIKRFRIDNWINVLLSK